MFQLPQFVWALRSSVLEVFNNFLLIDATDGSKISSNQKRFFIALSLYPLSFFIVILPPIAFACLAALSSFLSHFSISSFISLAYRSSPEQPKSRKFILKIVLKVLIYISGSMG